jgi:signal transduction histidine kinase
VIASDCTLPSEVQIVFYRIAQEALVNIAKHAKATQVSLKFDCTSAEAVLSISDNGCGFDINCVLVGHFGVTIMHERAEGIGAALDIDSQPGRGVYITLRWKDGGTSDA